jgi:hypothetical protein
MKLSLLLALLLCLASEQVFALKYMCNKAVRSNSGKINAIKGQFEYSKSNGSFANQKNQFISQIDVAIKTIESAGCPMGDPDVVKVVNPLNELKSLIEKTKGEASPETIVELSASTDTQVAPMANNIDSSAPVAKGAKLSYGCRQVMKRQSQKPKVFEREITYYENAVKKGNPVAIVEGLGFAEKLKASLKDIESGACPLGHPEVVAVTSILKAQLAKIPVLAQKIQAINSNQAKKSDVNNYPGFEKDFSFIIYLNDKYQDPSRYYDTNIKSDWREIKGSGQDKLSFMGVNVKKPFYDFESTKDIYKNIYSDSKKYNKLIIEIEKKYTDLFASNKKIAQKYVVARDNAHKKLASILTEHYKWITSTFPELIKTNNKVVNLIIDESLETKRSSHLRKVTIPDSILANSQMIEILGFLYKDQSKISSLEAAQSSLKNKFKSATNNLADLILKDARLPESKYTGADKEKIASAFLEAARNQLKGRDVLKIVMVNSDWDVTNYVTWSNSTAYHHHYSDLGARCIVKENDKVAKMITAWYRVNHKKNDKVTVWFEESSDKDIYQDPKILLENVN